MSFPNHFAATARADGTFEVFNWYSRGSGSTIWRATKPPGESWSAWTPVGDIRGEFTFLTADENPQLTQGVAIHRPGSSDPSGHQLLYADQPLGSDTWSPWTSLGMPPISDPEYLFSLTLRHNLDGRPEVFLGHGPSGIIWHRWRIDAGPDWSDWTPFPAPPLPDDCFAGAIDVGKNLDGRLELFTTAYLEGTGDMSLWHCWQIQPGGAWSSWQQLGSFPGLGTPRFPFVVQNGEGRLEVFAGAAGAVWHAWQIAPSASHQWLENSVSTAGASIGDFPCGFTEPRGFTLLGWSPYGRIWECRRPEVEEKWDPWTEIITPPQGMEIDCPTVVSYVSWHLLFRTSNGAVHHYHRDPDGSWGKVATLPHP